MTDADTVVNMEDNMEEEKSIDNTPTVHCSLVADDGADKATILCLHHL